MCGQSYALQTVTWD